MILFITQEAKYGAMPPQFSLTLFIRDSVNIFIFHIHQDSGYTLTALFEGLWERVWLAIFCWFSLRAATLINTAKYVRAQWWIAAVKTSFIQDHFWVSFESTVLYWTFHWSKYFKLFKKCTLFRAARICFW